MIVRNGALVMSVNDPQPILAVLPKAKYFRYKGRELVAVKHTLHNAKVLNNLGLKAPSPVLHGDYEFTGLYTPSDTQLKTVDFFTLWNRGYCFNEMRTGKTSSALWAVDYLKKIGEINRVLVICPVSVMEVWVDEAFKTLPHRSLLQVLGTPEKKLRLAKATADIHVINFDGLRAMYHEEYYPNSRRIKRKWHDLEDQYDLIIIDEASAYCNATNWRWKALKQIIKPDTRIWELTGSPLGDGTPTNAFGLITLIQPEKVPASFKLFEETLMRSLGPYKKVPRPGAIETVYDLMQPAIRFKRKESPFPTTIQSHATTMSEQQQKAFDDIKLKMLYEQGDTEVTAQNAAVKLIKLQQVMCGAVKDDEGNVIELNPKKRMEATLELVREANTKTVIFVPFKHSMYMLERYLAHHKIHSVVVNGDVSKSERTRLFSEFKTDDNCQVLIAHPKVTAHGLDFTCADTFIWYAPTFSTEQYTQANARGEGPNKTHAVGIYHIGCHPLEWRIYEVLKGKINMQDQLLDLYQSVLS